MFISIVMRVLSENHLAMHQRASCTGKLKCDFDEFSILVEGLEYPRITLPSDTISQSDMRWENFRNHPRDVSSHLVTSYSSQKQPSR